MSIQYSIFAQYNGERVSLLEEDLNYVIMAKPDEILSIWNEQIEINLSVEKSKLSNFEVYQHRKD